MNVMTAARSPLTPDAPPRPGLRERKKIRTREAIRTAAYALVEQQGYDTTTIEQIAERAEVSPSTVFRYFPAKEDIVVTDEYDEPLLAELAARPADEPWTDSVRYVIRKAVRLAMTEQPEVTALRARLMREVPAVRARMRETVTGVGRTLAEAIAARTGLDPEGLEVRVHATALVGGLLEATMYWAEHGHREDYADLADRALDVIEHGLPTGKG
ncbi:TetR family transcriptional regulator [Streptomyces cellulosae]|jgi:AcrR family transcriptional regulator|uniref:acyl-CoA-like ligand-binding transcription factor n=2 Tax=Streptomyces TaxID=1883 RepID=UPI00055B23DF|nr:TetR family transcriptional regulator [Streptomyces sp. McG8]MCX4479010.1 TetR family transcriptional regulator [Streptomyces cellulosae]WTB82052.1 TetR family transcriptional regulator [Streptomyces cellulosae]WTC56241.1 TetR family transcriptional regulator [Streptomyces cellulosae]